MAAEAGIVAPRPASTILLLRDSVGAAEGRVAMKSKSS